MVCNGAAWLCITEISWLLCSPAALVHLHHALRCCHALAPPCCLQEDGTLQQLHDSWIVSPDSGCHAFSQVNKGPQAVGFSDLSGLWVRANLQIPAGTRWCMRCRGACAAAVRARGIRHPGSRLAGPGALEALPTSPLRPALRPPATLAGDPWVRHRPGRAADGSAALGAALPKEAGRGPSPC